MDILYLIKDTPTNEEMKYSLRSLVNIPHDKVFLVGGCPKEIDKTKIIHIPLKQTPNKYQNTTTAIQAACKDPRLSEEFILMNDDFFILKLIQDPHKELNLCRGTMAEVIQEYTKIYRSDSNSYMVGMRQTKIFLEDLGIKNPLSYELHIPTIMAKNGVLRAFSLPYLHTLRVIHKRTIYGNLYQNDSQKVDDVKIRNKKDLEHLAIKEQKFLSTADDTWKYVKPYMQELFPEKGVYEI